MSFYGKYPPTGGGGGGGGPFLPLAGGTMSGNLSLGGNNITGVALLLATTVDAKIGMSASAGGAGVSAHVDTTAVACSTGTTEQDLIKYTVPASALGTNGDYLDFESPFTTVSRSDNQTIRFYYGSTKIFEASADFIGADVIFYGSIVRTGATSFKAMVSMNSLAGQTWVQYTAGTETLANALVLKATSQCDQSFANQVVQQFITVKWFPNN